MLNHFYYRNDHYTSPNAPEEHEYFNDRSLQEDKAYEDGHTVDEDEDDQPECEDPWHGSSKFPRAKESYKPSPLRKPKGPPEATGRAAAAAEKGLEDDLAHKAQTHRAQQRAARVPDSEALGKESKDAQPTGDDEADRRRQDRLFEVSEQQRRRREGDERIQKVYMWQEQIRREQEEFSKRFTQPRKSPPVPPYDWNFSPYNNNPDSAHRYYQSTSTPQREENQEIPTPRQQQEQQHQQARDRRSNPPPIWIPLRSSSPVALSSSSADYSLWTAAYKTMHSTFIFPDPPRTYRCRSRGFARQDACLKSTNVKVCQHGLERMLRGGSEEYSYAFLKGLTIMFHPDRFSRWPEEGGVREQGQEKAKEMFQLVRKLMEVEEEGRE